MGYKNLFFFCLIKNKNAKNKEFFQGQFQFLRNKFYTQNFPWISSEINNHQLRCLLSNLTRLVHNIQISKDKLPMASKMILDSISLSNNPTTFIEPITFNITFSLLQPLQHPLEWKIIYVGSAYSQDYDQELQTFQIQPVSRPSTMQFTVECSPPNPQKIPIKELLCVTAILLTVSYRKQQFIRVGFYVYNELVQPIEGIQNKPVQEIVNKIRRYIIGEKPRITNFNINWEEQIEKQEGSSFLEDISAGKQSISGYKKQSTKEESNNQISME